MDELMDRLMKGLMDQFRDELDLSTPDLKKPYYCYYGNVATNITLLMKLVLLDKDHSYLLDAYISNPCNTTQIHLDINKQASNGMTALMIACRNTNVCSTERAVGILLKFGAKVDMTDVNSWTALMFVFFNMNIDSTAGTAKLLLNANANVNVKRHNGSTLLNDLCLGKYNNDDTIDVLWIIIHLIEIDLIKKWDYYHQEQKFRTIIIKIIKKQLEKYNEITTIINIITKPTKRNTTNNNTNNGVNNVENIMGYIADDVVYDICSLKNIMIENRIKYMNFCSMKYLLKIGLLPSDIIILEYLFAI